MKNTLQKISILSLSLILISTYSVSCIIPELVKVFPDRSQESVELLISISSLAISITIALNIWLTRLLSERLSIILGAVLIAASGIGAMFIQSYGLMLFSRLLLGFGIGMINARAITMIQSRYQGREQAFLLGLRGSAEVLGNTFLTFAAGRLMLAGWRYAFVIYLFIIPILVLYLVFVPQTGEASEKELKEITENKIKQITERTEKQITEDPEKQIAEKKSEKTAAGRRKTAEEAAAPGLSAMDRKELFFLLQVFALGFIIINTNSAVTMRIPTLVVEKGFGTAADSSLILTFMLIVGVISGAFFERLLHLFRSRLLALGTVSVGAGMLIIGFSGSMAMVAVGVAFCGFSNGFLATVIFHKIAEVLPAAKVSYGTYAALLGCNLGAAASPMMLKLVGMIMPGNSGSYIVYGVFNVLLAVFLERTAGRSEVRSERTTE